METVVGAARRHAGEKVPNEDKVLSIFETHTELVQRYNLVTFLVVLI